jgi:hypothetical protein
MAFKPFGEYPVFLYRGFAIGDFKISQACEVQEAPWAQLSQCDTIEQPINMAWFTAFRFD